MPKLLPKINQTILDSAKTILMNEGYNSLSIRNVAKISGISVGTIYNYYSGKLEIVATIMLEDWQIILDKMDLTINEAKSINDGILSVYSLIREFAESYRGVWHDYSKLSESSNAINERHPMLMKQIEEKINNLYLKFDISESKEFISSLSELILVMAVYSNDGEFVIKNIIERVKES